MSEEAVAKGETMIVSGCASCLTFMSRVWMTGGGGGISGGSTGRSFTGDCVDVTALAFAADIALSSGSGLGAGEI
jgi:hypothetical protein